MKQLHSILPIFISLFILLPGSAYPEIKKTENIFDIQNEEIKITSISLKLDMKGSKVTFNGDVKLEGLKVEGDDITMSCQKLELYLKNTGKDTSIKSNDIDKIIATESIEIKRSDGSYATAEKAEYTKESEKISLTGNPYFTDGKGGEGHAPKIIIDIKEDTYSFEGTKEDKATLSRTGKDER
jgi:lipopolysaccharide transport protein LptA